LKEQERIADKIDGLANRIDRCRTLRKASFHEVSTLLKARLNTLASGFRQLGKFGEVLDGKPRNGWSARCDNAEGGTPVLTLSAVTGFHYDSTAYKRTSLPTVPDAHYWVRKGDLLLCTPVDIEGSDDWFDTDCVIVFESGDGYIGRVRHRLSTETHEVETWLGKSFGPSHLKYVARIVWIRRG